MQKYIRKGGFYIYRHLKPNGEVFYIGKSCNPKRAYDNRSRNKIWHSIVNSMPYYEVEILTTGHTEEFSKEIEKVLIAHYGRSRINKGPLCNITKGGETSTYGRVMEGWQKKRMSEFMKGRWIGKDNPNYGNHWTEEAKNRMSEIKKRQYETGEVVVNMEGVMRGVKNRNKKWEEHPECKETMRTKVSKALNKYEFLKIDRVTGEILKVYQSRLEVLEDNPDYKTSPLMSACNGYKNSYKGFLWRYRDRKSGNIIEDKHKIKIAELKS